MPKILLDDVFTVRIKTVSPIFGIHRCTRDLSTHNLVNSLECFCQVNQGVVHWYPQRHSHSAIALCIGNCCGRPAKDSTSHYHSTWWLCKNKTRGRRARGADQGGDRALCEGGADEEHDLLRLLHHPDARDRRALCLSVCRIPVCIVVWRLALKVHFTCKCHVKLPFVLMQQSAEQVLDTASVTPSPLISSSCKLWCAPLVSYAIAVRRYRA